MEFSDEGASESNDDNDDASENEELYTADEGDSDQQGEESTEEEGASSHNIDVDRTPTATRRRNRLQQASLDLVPNGTWVTKTKAKPMLFSPKMLRRLPSRSTNPLATTAVPSHGKPRPTSSSEHSRPKLPRKAKPGGSLKEDSSEEDRLTNEGEEGAEVDPVDGASVNSEDAQTDGSDQRSDAASEDDPLTVPATKTRHSQSRPRRGRPNGFPTTIVSSQDVFDEDSDLTEPSDDEEAVASEPEEADELDEEQEQEQDSEVDETPKATRTRRMNGGPQMRVAPPIAAEQHPPRGRRRANGRLARGKIVQEEEEDAPEEAVEPDDGANEEEEEEEEAAAGSEDGSEGGGMPEVEPRVLRNGKIVGELNDEEEVEEDGTEEDEEVDQIDEDASEELSTDNVEEEGEEASAEDGMEEVADEVEDDDMEEDFDLSEATAKTLGRLRRDDLVRLCETREIEADGTKHQLVRSLLVWVSSLSLSRSPSSAHRTCYISIKRDRQGTAPSSTQPSSYASTVKAPSTSRPAPRNQQHHRGHYSDEPVLMRSHRVHLTQPRTPDPDPDGQEIMLVGKDKDHCQHANGDELELDLESLGLEDREIPADKLTKSEKIGSGGFKE